MHSEPVLLEGIRLQCHFGRYYDCAGEIGLKEQYNTDSEAWEPGRGAGELLKSKPGEWTIFPLIF